MEKNEVIPAFEMLLDEIDAVVMALNEEAPLMLRYADAVMQVESIAPLRKSVIVRGGAGFHSKPSNGQKTT